MPYAASICSHMTGTQLNDSSQAKAPASTEAIHRMTQLRSIARTASDFDRWYPTNILFHYMLLRGHPFIPGTRHLIEQLNQPLFTLPEGVREGHEGRVRFLKRSWQHSMRNLTDAGTSGNPDTDEDWVVVDVGAIEGETWEELGAHGKKGA